MPLRGEFGMDRRKESRLFAEVVGSYELAGGPRRDVYISQISANGCRLGNPHHELEAGHAVQVSLGPVGPLDGTVKWASEDHAGVEFHATIHPAILAYFAGYCRVAS